MNILISALGSLWIICLILHYKKKPKSSSQSPYRPKGFPQNLIYDKENDVYYVVKMDVTLVTFMGSFNKILVPFYIFYEQYRDGEPFYKKYSGLNHSYKEAVKKFLLERSKTSHSLLERD